MPESTGEVTDVLLALRDGREGAFDHLLSLVYDDLRRIARRQLRRAPAGQPLESASLVHETYVKLVDQRRVEWQDRSHFYAVAARAMRQVLIDRARRQGRQKRGGGERALPLDEGRVSIDGDPVALLALDRALEKLEAVEPRLAQVVECRFFGGYSEEETAHALSVTARTVRRDWTRARAWLRVALGR